MRRRAPIRLNAGKAKVCNGWSALPSFTAAKAFAARLLLLGAGAHHFDGAAPPLSDVLKSLKHMSFGGEEGVGASCRVRVRFQRRSRFLGSQSLASHRHGIAASKAPTPVNDSDSQGLCQKVSPRQPSDPGVAGKNADD